jgi:hypothetical protein
MFKTAIKKNIQLLKIFNIIKYLIGKASITSIMPIYFDGWKMATGTRTPWMDGGGNTLSKKFTNTDRNLKKLVADRNIILSQFNPKHVIPELEALTWRHYIVYWSAQYAIDNTTIKHKNFAEFGVCDGLTVFYAISAAKENKVSFKFYLYDAWEGMKKEYLLESEKSSAGSYSYLNIENTKNNLNYLTADHLVFNKGYIPEIFDSAQNPEHLIWAHIDLNSAIPTLDALNKFWDCLEVGGVFLFDDFAYVGYEDTQREVELWATEKNCNIFHLPTGQAIIFKSLVENNIK